MDSDRGAVEIVAEVGSNWNGDLATFAELCEAAAAAGANTIKVQHYPDDLGPYPFTTDELAAADDLAADHNLEFLASVFDQRTLHEYREVCQPERVKIASPELTADLLLERCGGLHVLLSTGMSTMQQISHAIEVLQTANAHGVTLLQCTSVYPADAGEMNVRAIQTLRGTFHTPVGLSDHSMDCVVAPVLAVAYGASVIEKHFTMRRDQPGPDHWYAAEPWHLASMVDCVRIAEMMVGDGVKRVMPHEDPTDRR